MRLEIESNVAPHQFHNQQTVEPQDHAHGDTEQMLKKGIAAAQSGDRAAARSLLLRVTEADPNQVDAWLWLSSISEYPEELLGFLTKVLSLDPQNQRALEWEAATKTLLAKTFVQRGIAAKTDDEPEFARQCFDRAVSYDDRCESAWFWKSTLAQSDDEREDCLARVLDIDPDNQSAREAMNEISESRVASKLATAHNAAFAGETEKANEIVNELVEADTENLAAWLLRSQLAASFDEKLASYMRAFELDPENPFAKAGVEYLSQSKAVASTVAHHEPEMPAASAHELADEHENEYVPLHERETVEMRASDEPEASAPAEHVIEFPVMPKPSEPLLFEDEQPGPTRSYDTVLDLSLNGKAVDEAPDSVYEQEFAAPESVEEPPAFDPTLTTYGMKFESDVVEEPESYEPQTQPAEFSVEEAPYEQEFPAPPSFDSEFSTDEAVTVSRQASEVQSDDEINAALASINQGQAMHVYEEPMQKPFFEEPQVEEPEVQVVAEQEPAAAKQPQGNLVKCDFCEGENESQAFACSHCRAVLTLSEIELLFGESGVDRDAVQASVARMESEWDLRQLSEHELVSLALGHFNLGNYDQGMVYLHEAGQLNPNNVILGSQINTMAIRLEDLRRHEENVEAMPKGKTILVVDDSATVRKLISSKLEKCGHNVMCAVDGVEAMETLERVVPDLVLLDIAMPRMDGYSVCKLIRSKESVKDVPVVMISGKDGFFDKVRGKMAGTTGYITKPFGPETLMKALETYLLPEGSVQ